VVTEYSYDLAAQLVGMAYKKGATGLGNLTYEYDQAGQTTKTGGSLARTDLPTALGSTAYSDANQMTGFSTQSLTYDNNGNLTSDGSNTYTWNARNQLVAISGAGLSASFTYDAGGRRSSKTINGTTTSYLYDGVNVVQEQVGGSASANLLTGGVDELFSRTDGSGTWSPIVDGLGSLIALTDSSGAVQTSYSYEPFGKATATGTASSNPQTYTGREEDAFSVVVACPCK
jgi:YD repeat-containing protein